MLKLRLFTATFSALLLFASPSTWAQIVNIDVGVVEEAYVGQGALSDLGNNTWSRVIDGGFNLIASDGVTPTSVSLSITSQNGFDYEGLNSNGVVNDYVFVSTFNGPETYIGDIEFFQLTAGASYEIYVYSAGDTDGQGALIELNGVKAATSGVVSEEFVEGGNYVVMEVVADNDGKIIGTYRPFDSASSGSINGFQIRQVEPSSRVLSISGAESPVVHSPGDTISVTVDFTNPVVLSQEGGLRLMIDIEGQFIEALHTGETTGTELTFTAIAPGTTTFEAKVIADSLELVGTATITHVDTPNVILTNKETDLSNDQISTLGLSVYPDAPGLAEIASPHYSFRVREEGQNWQSSYAWITKAIDSSPDTNMIGYYNDFVGGWSHTYTNFEMANNVPVEIEITRLDPVTGEQVDIQTATPLPGRNVRTFRVEDGRAYVTINQPTLLAVDIDGEFDRPDLNGNFLNENALHAVSIFANPFILDKPNPGDPDVLSVAPGTVPPTDGNWTTLYFEPGVHQIFDGDWEVGDQFRIRSNRSYYIPGNAIVHGNFLNEDDDNDSRNIRIFGHGTLSGERIPHWQEQGLAGGEDNPGAYLNRAIRIANKARGSSIEGITVADPANHAVALVGPFSADTDNYNYVRWSKVFSWRANGDGISPNGSSYVEDNFLRVQDDGTYPSGLGIRRMTYWSDVNGMALRLSNILNDNPAVYRYVGPLVVEDIDVIFARTAFGSGPGRSIIGFPDPAIPFFGNDGSHVLFRDIRISDNFPTRTLFGWDMTSGMNGGTQPVSNVRFENVRSAARNIDNELDPFIGTAIAPISGLVFDNVLLGGDHYDGLEDFVVNEFVSDLSFVNTEEELVRYIDGPGYSKWNNDDRWDTGVEPSAQDQVNFTQFGGTVRVDSTAYALSVGVASPANPIVLIADQGDLRITDFTTILGGTRGSVRLAGGTLTMLDDSSTSIQAGTESIHIGEGTIVWSGNQVGQIQIYFDASVFVLNEGSNVEPTANSVLIGSSGPDQLYSEYDAATNVTRTWVYRSALDSDEDGIDDTLDNCLWFANASQLDTDGDGFGNACDADFNNDCSINFLDYSVLTQNFLSTQDELFDLNGDGVINFIDVSIFSGVFLGEPGPSAVNTICQ
ncbi:MAG: dockerin type I domain-containing protein [Gammaproteobacteria bacterium]